MKVLLFVYQLMPPLTCCCLYESNGSHLQSTSMKRLPSSNLCNGDKHRNACTKCLGHHILLT